MKYAALVDALSARSRLPHVTAKRVLDNLAEIIGNELARNQPVQIRELGWLEPHTWRRRKLYDINTGAVTVPKPVRSAKLRPSPALLAKLKLKRERKKHEYLHANSKASIALGKGTDNRMDKG